MNKKYTFNQNFFEVINTEDKAYWLGFLAADGYLQAKSTGNRAVSLTLRNSDSIMLEKFKISLNSNNPIRKKKIHNTSTITINSQKMYNDLLDKGLFQNKSLTLGEPKNVPDNLIYHWVRGYFDGDGSVHIFIDKRGNRNSPHLKTSFVGTKDVLNFIKKHTDLDQSIKQAGVSKAFMTRTSGPKKGLHLYKYLYRDATIFLERKRLKFEEYIKQKEIYSNGYLW